MPRMIVRVLKPKNGKIRAQIRVGAKAYPATDLTEFNKRIQDVFGKTPQPGDEVSCEHTDNPTHKSVTPAPGATVRHGVTDQSPKPAQPPNQDKTCELQGFDGEKLSFDPNQTDNHGQPLTVDALKVTDRFLAARPGARFKTGQERTLVRYADDIVAMGLEPEPNIDRNPYNFVPWIGREPNEAQEPEHATHDRIADDRLSGRINVTFTAQTPIFVPEGQLRENDDPNDSSNAVDSLDFFHCWNGSCCRYAIPGASVKGAVRSLFEALTNSRAGVTDDTTLRWPPLYRRRSSRLYKILRMPTGPSAPGQVQECAYALCDCNGIPREFRPHEVHRKTATGYQNHHLEIAERAWRANLFWVKPKLHRHGPKKKIRFHPRAGIPSLNLSKGTVDQFLSMKGHPHLDDHPENAATAARQTYQGRAPSYNQIESALFGLDEGDIVFGIPNGNELRCFGKNVNFLWPGASSPLQMMGSGGADHGADRGPFAAREPAKQQIKGSDPAEATFGFAGKHTGDSHPFRGRVRFGTFWGPCVPEPKPKDYYLQLMPLTAPSGTKAKARPLYLEPKPKSDGLSANYDDDDARLRGRKFYWHQRGTDGNIPEVHDFGKLSPSVPKTWTDEIQELPAKKRQLPAKIRPLPAGSQFEGTLHFTNLTKAELGALLVSVKPDLALGSEASTGSAATDSPGYGIKLGKGKPRGLGSVTASIGLELATPPSQRYRCLDASLAARETDTARYVKAYKAWCVESTKPGGGKDKAPQDKWEDLDMAEALKVLLQIPKETSVRVYPPQFAMYGWLPDLNKPDGRPRGQYPKAMTPAHKLKGP